tara:strand:- start:984 stop:1712 length:729 start_codon:yes stop_codon:yes gene_type:complete
MKNLTISLTCLILLGGCFEIEQNLIIGSKGSTEYKITLTMDQTLALPSMNTEQEICKSHLQESLNKETFTFSSKEFRKGKSFGCIYQLNSSFQDFYELLNSGALDEIFLMEENPSQRNNLKSQKLLEIERISNKTYKITSLINADEYDSNLSQGQVDELNNPFGELDSFFQKSLESMFLGKRFIFSLEAPKIIKSNSRILNNGKETRIDLPISNLIKEKDIYFESTFYVGESADDPFSSFLK